jgi:hypothetical protein
VNSQVLRIAWYRFRATFARRWGGYLAVVLLIGLVGGLAMGAVAGARRTQSSFPTYLASTNPSQLNLFTANWAAGSDARSGADLSVARTIAHLPHVRRVENEYNLNAQELGPNGTPAPPPAGAGSLNGLNTNGSLDGELSDQDRLTAIEGRLADPKRANEIVVSAIVAQLLRLHVGSVLPFGFYTDAQAALLGYGRPTFKVQAARRREGALGARRAIGVARRALSLEAT